MLLVHKRSCLPFSWRPRQFCLKFPFCERKSTNIAEKESIWISQNLSLAPEGFVHLRKPIPTDKALEILFSKSGILWEGDYHHGKTFLSKIAKYFDRVYSILPKGTIKKRFLAFKMFQTKRAVVLSKFAVLVSPEHSMAHLSRAPNISMALKAAFNNEGASYIVPLREVLGAIGSWEWRKEGVKIPILENSLHPHYGVFCPTVRNDYIKLISTVTISPKAKLAYDIGVGSGVLSAILIRRGIKEVVGTDTSDRALLCARDNLTRFGMISKTQLIKSDVYPPSCVSMGHKKPDLIVCNPPWLPMTVSSSLLDEAIYDENNSFLISFLNGIENHLSEEAHSEAFLILSDLAEHIGLRSRKELLDMFETANLMVVDKLESVPCNHPRRRLNSGADILSEARRMEVTNLWRLKIKR